MTAVLRRRAPAEASAVMEAFNKELGEGSLRAEVVEIACSDLCAVAVMKTTINKVWQYI